MDGFTNPAVAALMQRELQPLLLGMVEAAWSASWLMSMSKVESTKCLVFSLSHVFVEGLVPVSAHSTAPFSRDYGSLH